MADFVNVDDEAYRLMLDEAAREKSVREGGQEMSGKKIHEIVSTAWDSKGERVRGRERAGMEGGEGGGRGEGGEGREEGQRREERGGRRGKRRGRDRGGGERREGEGRKGE